MDNAIEENLRADNTILRKQILAYRDDLELARKVSFWIIKNGDKRSATACQRLLDALRER